SSRELEHYGKRGRKQYPEPRQEPMASVHVCAVARSRDRRVAHSASHAHGTSSDVSGGKPAAMLPRLASVRPSGGVVHRRHQDLLRRGERSRNIHVSSSTSSTGVKNQSKIRLPPIAATASLPVPGSISASALRDR